MFRSRSFKGAVLFKTGVWPEVPALRVPVSSSISQ